MIESDYLDDNINYFEKLGKMPRLSDFSKKDLKGLLELSKIRKYKPEELILEEGFYDNRIFFLVSGKIKVVKHDEVLRILRRTGDVFGEMGIIDGSPRSASVYAVDETVCLATDASYIDRLADNEKNAFSCILYRIFSEILASRLRSTSEELIKIKDENEMLKREAE